LPQTLKDFLSNEHLKQVHMCTITLEYNQNNALARRKLAALLATGLFLQKEVTSSEPSDEEEKLHREEMKAFLAHSKKSMSTIIARYL
jgi:hypothetical protein